MWLMKDKGYEKMARLLCDGRFCELLKKNEIGLSVQNLFDMQ